MTVACPSNRAVKSISGSTAVCSSFEVQAVIDSCPANKRLAAAALNGNATCLVDALAADLADCAKQGYHFDIEK